MQVAQANRELYHHFCSLYDLGSREPAEFPVNYNRVINSAQGSKRIMSHLIKSGLVAQYSLAAEQLYGSLLIPQGLAAVGGPRSRRLVT